MMRAKAPAPTSTQPSPRSHCSRIHFAVSISASFGRPTPEACGYRGIDQFEIGLRPAMGIPMVRVSEVTVLQDHVEVTVRRSCVGVGVEGQWRGQSTQVVVLYARQPLQKLGRRGCGTEKLVGGPRP